MFDHFQSKVFKLQEGGPTDHLLSSLYQSRGEADLFIYFYHLSLVGTAAVIKQLIALMFNKKYGQAFYLALISG